MYFIIVEDSDICIVDCCHTWGGQIIPLQLHLYIYIHMYSECRIILSS